MFKYDLPEKRERELATLLNVNLHWKWEL